MSPSLLSRSFDLLEFACHSGEPVPRGYHANAADLATMVLQPLRDEWREPLLIVSGWRSLTWNMGIGGAKASTHLTCEGADIRPVHLADVAVLHSLALTMRTQGRLPGLGGLGEYPSWVHVDIRHATDGHLRRWKGVGMGSEP